MSEDKILELLQSVAKSLGVAVETLITWFSKRAFAEGVAELVIAGLLIVPSVWLYRKMFVDFLRLSFASDGSAIPGANTAGGVVSPSSPAIFPKRGKRA